MEKVTQTIKGKKSLVLSIVPLIIIVLIVASDLTVQYYHTPAGAECQNYVIYDVYGLLENSTIANESCYYTGLSVSDFRALGKVKADKIIIVTHNFYQGKVTGLGTSDKASPLTPILHPISIFYLVKGETSDGETYLAVSPGIASLSAPLNGKTIIIITCSENIDEIASGILSMGADTVIVSNSPVLSPEEAVILAKKAINGDALTLCATPTFHCYGG